MLMDCCLMSEPLIKSCRHYFPICQKRWLSSSRSQLLQHHQHQSQSLEMCNYHVGKEWETIIISDNMKAKWLQPLFWRQSGSVSGTNRGNNEVTLSLDVLVDETEKIDNKQKKTHLTYSCYWSVQLTTYILSPIFCLSFCNLPGGARLFIYI